MIVGSKRTIAIKYKDHICVKKAGLKTTSIFVILLSQNGFESDFPNNHFLKSVQKQPESDVLQNRCSSKFRNKKTVLESVLKLKKRFQHRCFPVNILKFLRAAFFRTPPVAAFASLMKYLFSIGHLPTFSS